MPCCEVRCFELVVLMMYYDKPIFLQLPADTGVTAKVKWEHWISDLWISLLKTFSNHDFYYSMIQHGTISELKTQLAMCETAFKMFLSEWTDGIICWGRERRTASIWKSCEVSTRLHPNEWNVLLIDLLYFPLVLFFHISINYFFFVCEAFWGDCLFWLRAAYQAHRHETCTDVPNKSTHTSTELEPLILFPCPRDAPPPPKKTTTT